MRKIGYHRIFLKDFPKLPYEIKKKLSELENIVRENHFHPTLHTKKLQGNLSHLYSFRITREYRVIFMLEEDDRLILLSVKHRKEIYDK